MPVLSYSCFSWLELAVRTVGREQVENWKEVGRIGPFSSATAREARQGSC